MFSDFIHSSKREEKDNNIQVRCNLLFVIYITIIILIIFIIFYIIIIREFNYILQAFRKLITMKPFRLQTWTVVWKLIIWINWIILKRFLCFFIMIFLLYFISLLFFILFYFLYTFLSNRLLQLAKPILEMSIQILKITMYFVKRLNVK